MANSDTLSSFASGSFGRYGAFAGSEGVACLESELDIFVLQCTFIILELFVLNPS